MRNKSHSSCLKTIYSNTVRPDIRAKKESRIQTHEFRNKRKYAFVILTPVFFCTPISCIVLLLERVLLK